MEKYFEMRMYLNIYAPIIILGIISIVRGYVGIKEKIEKRRREKEK